MTSFIQRTRLGRAAAVALTAVLTTSCSDGAPTEPTAPLVPPTFTFTTIQVPNARSTTPQGINANGDIVGNFVDANGATHGFLLRSGVFTTIDYPGAGRSTARGINAAGDIVGTYAAATDPSVVALGYRRTNDGRFQGISFPGKKHVILQRVLDDGTIFGCAHDDDLMMSMVGITIGSQGSNAITAFASMNNGATRDLKHVVGLYTRMPENRGEAYLIDDGTFTPFTAPTSTSTQGWDINERGETVGLFQDAVGFHGFISTQASGFTAINYPGASATRAFGINKAGDVVGSYVGADGVTNGFLAKRAY